MSDEIRSIDRLVSGAALAEIRAMALAVVARCDAVLGEPETVSQETVTAEPESDPHPEYLDAPVLARRLGVRADTVRKWIREEGLGIKRGGRWMADVRAVRERAARCRD